MLSEVVVGDDDIGGAADDIHQPISASREVAMVDPHILAGKDGDCILIRPAPAAHIRGGAHDPPWPRWLDVVDGDAVDDDVIHILEGGP